jgi:hypothetical protein
MDHAAAAHGAPRSAEKCTQYSNYPYNYCVPLSVDTFDRVGQRFTERTQDTGLLRTVTRHSRKQQL